MFKFLKDKLKSWTEKVANAPQDESSTPVSEEIKEDLTKTPEIKEESKQIIEEIKEIKKEKKKKELPKQKEKTDKEKDEIINKLFDDIDMRVLTLKNLKKSIKDFPIPLKIILQESTVFFGINIGHLSISQSIRTDTW